MTTRPYGQHPAPPGQSAADLQRREPPRLATPADASMLVKLHAAAFAEPDAWSADVFTLQLQLPNVIGLVAAEDGFILVRIAADEAEILTLAVVPRSRRNGVATELLHSAITHLAAAGANVIFLEVSVKNTAAQGLYLQLGFIQTGRRPGYYSDRSDALVLRMNLSSPA